MLNVAAYIIGACVTTGVAVASLGTALTEEQGRLLRKYSEQVVMSYDSDGAGQEAIMRGLEILENQGCDARVIQMDGAKDPDEYIIKYGSERFKLLTKDAISLVEFKIKMLRKQYDLENATDKVRFLKEITKILFRLVAKGVVKCLLIAYKAIINGNFR